MEISVEMCATENKTKTATMAMPPSGVVGNIHFSRFEVSGFNCLSLSLSLLIVGSTIVLNKRAPRRVLVVNSITSIVYDCIDLQ